ncbi:MAG: hypothetical protein IJH82_09910, partial [Lachnospiraceae bacterium]|nr:hypothetical protein [Lachnospiraceae bacterium]
MAKRKLNWKNIKRAGAIGLAVVTIASTLSFSGSITGGNRVEAAENIPAVMDASSAVNYATILGRATDFGIVAEEFHHYMHMETTLATNHLYQEHTGDVTDVDFVVGTAQFIISNIEKGFFALGGNQKASTYNVEVGKTAYNMPNPDAANYKDKMAYPIPLSNGTTQGTGTAGHLKVDYDFASDPSKTLNLYPIDDDACEKNVNRIIENMQEKSEEINE